MENTEKLLSEQALKQVSTMEAIRIENNLSKIYELKTFKVDGKEILELSLDNVARVEAMIQMDSNYTMSGNVDAIPSKRTNGTFYKGSTAYWMTQLKRIISGEKTIECTIAKDGEVKQKIMGWEEVAIETISAIDRENSTHLNVANGRQVFFENLTTVYMSGNLELLLRSPQYKAKEYIINLLNPSVRVNVTKNKKIIHTREGVILLPQNFVTMPATICLKENPSKIIFPSMMIY